tara:strand:+ start:511 stop:873 length:363 start_codon:yes stop_codon:yes gene_type:complete
MAFTRKSINTTSTFQTGATSSFVNTPTFTQWTNTTNSNGIFWDLSTNWGISISSDNSTLNFNLNGVSVASIGADGFNVNVTASGDKLALTNYSSLPSTTENTEGTMIRYNNEMYILEGDD